MALTYSYHPVIKGHSRQAQLLNTLGKTYYDSIDMPDIIQIECGSNFSVQLKSDGTVWTWGNNNYGQLGNPDYSQSSFPLQVKGVNNVGYLQNIVQIQQGQYHCLQLDKNGVVYQWGNNGYVQLGDSSSSNRSVPVISIFSDSVNIIQITQGPYNSLQLADNGYAYACGHNYYGSIQLGNSGTNQPTFQKMLYSSSTPLSGVIAIQQGYSNSYILRNNNIIYSCGWNYYGKLGIGTTDTLTSHYYLNNIVKTSSGTNLSNVINISQSNNHCVQLKNDGTLWQWGDGTTADRTYASQVHGVENSGYLRNIVNISLGKYYNSSQIDNQGKRYVWGQNNYYALGTGTNTTIQYPTIANVSENAKHIMSQPGQYHSAQLLDNGMLYQVGSNTDGRLGDGTLIDKTTFVNVKENWAKYFRFFTLQNYLLEKNNEYYLINDNNEIYKPEEQTLQNLKDLQFAYPPTETLFSQILNESFNILYFSKKPLTQQSILTSDIEIIPNNQLIKMKDFILTQDFSNIDKITLTQNINENISEINNLNSENNYILPEYINNLNLTFDINETSELLNNNNINFYKLSINDLINKYSNIIEIKYEGGN